MITSIDYDGFPKVDGSYVSIRRDLIESIGTEDGGKTTIVTLQSGRTHHLAVEFTKYGNAIGKVNNKTIS